MSRAGIVAFAFGAPKTIRSNLVIGSIVRINAGKLSAPVYTQLDTGNFSLHVTYTREKPGSPPPTLRIARGAVQWAIRINLKVLWIACAGPHLWRCKRDLRYAIKESGAKINVKICRSIRAHSSSTWFCSDSEQKRTRSWVKWYPRELLLRFTPLRWMWLYKKVAS